MLDRQGCFRSDFLDEKKELALSIHAMNRADGMLDHLFDYSFHTASRFSLQLSHQGGMLALVQDDIQLVDLTTRARLLHIQGVTDQTVVAFSADDRSLAMVTNKKVQVWDIQRQRCVHEFELPRQPTLPEELKQVAGITIFQTAGPMHLHFNSSSTLLAVVHGRGLGVYDLVHHRKIGEAACDGIPRFTADRTLAILRPGLIPMKPVESYYQMQEEGMEKVFDDATEYRSSHAGLSLTDSHYLTACDISKREPWPSWLPQRVKEFLLIHWPKMSPTWSLSLRSIQKGDEEKSITFPITEPNSASYCGFTEIITQATFHARLSQENRWLLIDDSEAIELWPFDTIGVRGSVGC
ncbi:MAG TPA: hypothetical protein PLN21_15020 [Gemmatales bacterium]|nr:hypothetical protein [Gemmatales bacterium]